MSAAAHGIRAREVLRSQQTGGSGAKRYTKPAVMEDTTMAAQTQTTQQTCPQCGMSKEDWKGNGGRGVTKSGKTFCCQGCADGDECTCGD